jgi:integrase
MGRQRMGLNARNDEPAPGRRVRVERGIYRQPNGKYAVCFMLDGKARFRTVGYDVALARTEREILVRAASYGVLATAPKLRFATVAHWWLARFERRVAAGERRPRTLDLHRYHLRRHLLPSLGDELARTIRPEQVTRLIEQMRSQERSETTIAGALATLHSVMRFAVRNAWIAENPVEKLEHHERPHPTRRAQRVLGQQEITALLAAATATSRLPIITALYTGRRISELLGLTWDDIDLPRATLQVRAQLSRASRGAPARRVPPKTAAARREIPLAPPLVKLLRAHKDASMFTAPSDWVLATSRGTPYNHRNAQRWFADAARRAELDDAGQRLRLHDLRHTFASHLVIDIGLDVVQVSRILGHARSSTTLNIYAHMFDHARHATSLRRAIAASTFVSLLDPPAERDLNVIPFPARTPRRQGTPTAVPPELGETRKPSDTARSTGQHWNATPGSGGSAPAHGGARSARPSPPATSEPLTILQEGGRDAE